MKRNLPDSVYDQPTLLTMWSDLIEAQDDILAGVDDANLVINLKNARQHLVDFLGHNPIRPEEDIEEPVDAYDGQSSTATPSAILMRRLDFNRTFGISRIFSNLQYDLQKLVNILNRLQNGDSADEILEDDPESADLLELALSQGLAAVAISSVINHVANFFAKAIASCNKLIQQANETLLEFKALIDAMLSQVNSLIGGGSYDSSMLRCAINFNLGISGLGPLLAILTNLLCALSTLITNFLNTFTTWIVDLINKVLCLPLGLINAYLGQINASIPAVCQLPNLDLGVRITQALSNLQTIGTSKNAIAVSLGNDIFSVRMIVNGLPERMAQFNLSGGADCNAKVNEAYNASLLNFQSGVSLV